MNVERMRTGLILTGSILFIIGITLDFYASQRKCLICFPTRGYMSFWIGIELLAGFVVLGSLIIAIFGMIVKN